MELIQTLNESNNIKQAEYDLFEANIDAYAADAEVDAIELTESIIEWLGNLQKDAAEGKLGRPQGDNSAAMADHASSMNAKANIMGAVMALVDPDQAEALNIKNPAGLLRAAASNHPQSDKVLNHLMGIGRSSAKGFAKKAAELMQSEDKNALVQAARDLQNRAKKLILIKKPPQEQRPSEPGKMGLADKMAEKPTI